MIVTADSASEVSLFRVYNAKTAAVSAVRKSQDNNTESEDEEEEEHVISYLLKDEPSHYIVTLEARDPSNDDGGARQRQGWCGDSGARKSSDLQKTRPASLRDNSSAVAPVGTESEGSEELTTGRGKDEDEEMGKEKQVEKKSDPMNKVKLIGMEYYAVASQEEEEKLLESHWKPRRITTLGERKKKKKQSKKKKKKRKKKKKKKSQTSFDSVPTWGYPTPVVVPSSIPRNRTRRNRNQIPDRRRRQWSFKSTGGDTVKRNTWLKVCYFLYPLSSLSLSLLLFLSPSLSLSSLSLSL